MKKRELTNAQLQQQKSDLPRLASMQRMWRLESSTRSSCCSRRLKQSAAFCMQQVSKVLRRSPSSLQLCSTTSPISCPWSHMVAAAGAGAAVLQSQALQHHAPEASPKVWQRYRGCATSQV
eukprot:1148123-Pelagomonas_calceolata.AAC.1